MQNAEKNFFVFSQRPKKFFSLHNDLFRCLEGDDSDGDGDKSEDDKNLKNDNIKRNDIVIIETNAASFQK